MAYAWYRSININHSLCGSSDSTDFPVCFSTTHADLRSVGNGGHVQSSSGYDIGFFSDAALTTALPFELEKYTASTGEVIAWIKLPTLSHTTNTKIYVGYGDSGITSDQSSTSAWNSAFKAVYHFKAGLSVADATSNAANGTNSGATASTSGKIGGCASFDGISNFIAIPDFVAGDFTVSFWANVASFTGDTANTPFAFDNYSASPRNAIIFQVKHSASNITYWETDVNAGGSTDIGGATIGAWHRYSFRRSGTTVTPYIDGTAQTAITVSSGSVTFQNGRLGTHYYLGTEQPEHFNGLLDQLTLSNVARSADWITAEYNNQSSPGTFYSFGAETVAGTAEVALAFFDGSGSNYFQATLPAEMQGSPPFWYALQLSPECETQRNDDILARHTGPYTAFAAQKTDASEYVNLYLNLNQMFTKSQDSGGSTALQSTHCILNFPFFDSVIVQVASATERYLYFNGVLEAGGTGQTSRSPALSSGTPILQIGRQWWGNIANVLCGTGTLTSGDRTLHATRGADYSSMTGATHWWKLDGSGTDSIGSVTLTEIGAMAYNANIPAPVTTTKAGLIAQIFKAKGYPVGVCSVTSGGSPPVTVTVGLASVSHLDASYDGMDANDNPFPARMWLYQAATPVFPRHLVTYHGGHENESDIPGFRGDVLIKALVGAGYDVLQIEMPYYDATHTTAPDGSSGITAQQRCYDRLSSTVNPLEKFYAPAIMALNTIGANYAHISGTGLSGGGNFHVTLAAMEPRYNHTIMPQHGTMSYRRDIAGQLFENFSITIGTKIEDVYPLTAYPNRRFWIISGPNDPTTCAQFGSSGAYLDRVDYKAYALDPIKALYPKVDVDFLEEPSVGGAGDGYSAHLNSDFLVTTLIGALARPLTPLTNPRPVKLRLGLRAA